MPIFRKHDDAPRERTPEERERARAERQARRASRSGPDEPLAGAERDPDPPRAAPRDLGPPRELADDLSDEPRGAAPLDDFTDDLPPLPDPPPPAPEPRDFGDDLPPLPPPPPDPPSLEGAERRGLAERRDLEEEPPPVPKRRDVEEEPPPVPKRRYFAEDLPPVPPPPDPLPPAPEALAAESRGFEEEPLASEPRGFEEPLAAETHGLGDEALPAEHRFEGEAPPAPAPERAAAEEGGGAADDAAPLQPTAPFDPLAQPGEEREPIVPPAARRARSGRGAARPVDDGERPTPPKPVAARERRLPPTPPPPGTPAFSKRRRRRGRILAGLVLLVLAAFLFGLNLLFQPFKGDGGETVTVRIPPNSTVADVGDLLADNEIVDNSLLFVVRARLAGADLKAGTYQLKEDSSYGDALDALADDPAAPRTVKVVIPEGRSRTETAPIVEDAGLAGGYVKASASSKGFRPRKYGAPRNTRTLEGFLFPATYELTPGASAAKLVAQQLDAFEQNIGKVDMKRARRRNLSVYDVLIIASMVEREATLAKERPLISAVIHNRLRSGEPLGIDATIRYAVRNWTEPLKQSELNIDSPYNTRRRAGLPPTPIGSPGLDSIRAAANPANVDYRYYVVKVNGNGAHEFSATIEEFERDVARYNAERERRGGKSPAESG